MNDRPSIWVRGLISVATAVAVNVVLFYAFDAMGIALRVLAQMGGTEMTDMSLPAVLDFTAVPTRFLRLHHPTRRRFGSTLGRPDLLAFVNVLVGRDPRWKRR